MAVTYSESDQEFYDKVRRLLGDADETFVNDDNIEEQRDTVVLPYIDRNIDEDKHDQEDIDAALLAYTAYRAFSSIPLMSTISGGGLTANLSPAQYQDELRHTASVALSGIGLTLPQENGGTPFAARTDGMLRD